MRVLLGHSSVKTTEKYAEFDMAELDQDFDIDEQESENDEKQDRKSRGFSSGMPDRSSQRMYGVS